MLPFLIKIMCLPLLNGAYPQDCPRELCVRIPRECKFHVGSTPRKHRSSKARDSCDVKNRTSKIVPSPWYVRAAAWTSPSRVPGLSHTRLALPSRASLKPCHKPITLMRISVKISVARRRPRAVSNTSLFKNKQQLARHVPVHRPRREPNEHIPLPSHCHHSR